jgi:hypothetical protein
VNAAPTLRDQLVIFKARAHTFHRRLARVALERRDLVQCRYHLRIARQAAAMVRVVASDCEREAEMEAWLAERAALPAPDALDSDLAAFEAALEQLA